MKTETAKHVARTRQQLESIAARLATECFGHFDGDEVSVRLLQTTEDCKEIIIDMLGREATEGELLVIAHFANEKIESAIEAQQN